MKFCRIRTKPTAISIRASLGFFPVENVYVRDYATNISPRLARRKVERRGGSLETESRLV